jgi:hypothetical protein
MRKLTEELAHDPDLRDEVCGSIRMWIDDAAEKFRAAQAEGSVRGDIDAATFAEVAVGSMVGMQVLSEQLGDGHFVERVESLVAMIQQAIVPSSASVRPVPSIRQEELSHDV